MSKNIKITIEIPEKLLKNAQEFTGVGIEETVQRALQLLASAKAYKEMRGLRGKVKFSRRYTDLKYDKL